MFAELEWRSGILDGSEWQCTCVQFELLQRGCEMKGEDLGMEDKVPDNIRDSLRILTSIQAREVLQPVSLATYVRHGFGRQVICGKSHQAGSISQSLFGP